MSAAVVLESRQHMSSCLCLVLTLLIIALPLQDRDGTDAEQVPMAVSVLVSFRSVPMLSAHHGIPSYSLCAVSVTLDMQA